MIVKIRGKLYSDVHEPVMVILTKRDKEFIRNMPEHQAKYCAYPDGTTPQEVEKFMEIKD